MKRPFGSECAVCAVDEVSDFKVIVALEISAPLGSLTLPCNVAKSCELAIPVERRSINPTHDNDLASFAISVIGP